MTTALHKLAEALSISIDSQGLETLASQATLTRCPKGARLFASGDVCETFVVLIKGIAKVQLSTRTGREISWTEQTMT